MAKPTLPCADRFKDFERTTLGWAEPTNWVKPGPLADDHLTRAGAKLSQLLRATAAGEGGPNMQGMRHHSSLPLTTTHGAKRHS
jgi:hypothetical protein